MKLRQGLTAFATAVLVAALPGGADSASRAPSATSCQNGDATVSVVNFRFSPSTMTVTPGTTVCWTNNSAATTHTVTSDTTGAFDSGNLAAGDSFRQPFPTNGSFNYHCNFHAQMTGTITVSSSPPPPPTPPPPPPPAPTPPPASPAPPPPPPPSPPTIQSAHCVVPRLRGKTLKAAKRLLARRSCALGSVRRAYSTDGHAGLVMSQRPKPGARLAAGARVNLVVSRGRRR